MVYRAGPSLQPVHLRRPRQSVVKDCGQSPFLLIESKFFFWEIMKTTQIANKRRLGENDTNELYTVCFTFLEHRQTCV